MNVADHFRGVVSKRLSRVEVRPENSNQHEFNGTKALVALLGTDRLERVPARFIYLSDRAEERVQANAWVTWYDARERHLTRTEYRCYYPANAAMARARAGDSLHVCLLRSGDFLIILAEESSTAESQLAFLFGQEVPETGPFHGRLFGDDGRDVGLAERAVLDALDLNVETPDTDLDALIARFGEDFPSTRDFSEFARESAGSVDPVHDPDGALYVWMDTEERLFRQFEAHLCNERIAAGFPTMDDFVGYALRIVNRRKARAGLALENHLESVLRCNHLLFTRGARTEGKKRPDFLFPTEADYHNPNFDPALLTLLGVKQSCKDRWRQVLSEGDRVPHKHLLTLEPAISAAQLGEMAAARLTLVVPEALHATYSGAHAGVVSAVKPFLETVRSRQDAAID